MKKVKKVYWCRNLLFTLTMVGLLAAGPGLAGTAQAGQTKFRLAPQQLKVNTGKRAVMPKLPADLQVRLWLDTASIHKSNARCTSRCSWDFVIKASVKNIGQGDFIPTSPNAQVLQLFAPDQNNASRPVLWIQWPFGRLNHGQTKNVSVHMQKQPGPTIEFAADYKVKIQFGPDSPGDRNRRNNQATLSRRSVVYAINHAHPISSSTKLKAIMPAYRH